jgi:hypothetical protein
MKGKIELYGGPLDGTLVDAPHDARQVIAFRELIDQCVGGRYEPDLTSARVPLRGLTRAVTRQVASRYTWHPALGPRPRRAGS